VPASPEPRAGHGIIGMRERVSLCGGEFTAGPRPEGGFMVRARLPLAGLTS
jgi:signal transduction histidine kinase